MSEKPIRLSQVVAIETDTKHKIHPQITKIHKLSQKSEMYEGSTAVYENSVEDGEEYPPQRTRVRMVADQVLEEMAELWQELLDATATKEFGNCDPDARADLVVEGKVLVESAPVPLLLFLEKQFADVRKAIEVIPVLDAAEDWVFDREQGMYRTREPVRKQKTRQVQEPVVLYPATKEHPAQTQLITKTVTVGYWVGTRFSGGLSMTRKKDLLKRVTTLIKAIKTAREEANTTKVSRKEIGAKLFDFVFDRFEAS